MGARSINGMAGSSCVPQVYGMKSASHLTEAVMARRRLLPLLVLADGQRATKRGRFDGVPHLVRTIESFIAD